VLQQKSKKPISNDENAGAGLKAAARRAAFADLSNKVNTVVSKRNGKGGVVIVQEKESLKTAAISKPPQRITTTKPPIKQQPAPSQQAGPRRATRKTAVYEDKKPSPKRRASPKISRDAISKRDHATRPNGARSQAPLPPISRVKHQESKEDDPVYSDQQPHLYDEDYVDDEDAVEIEEYDDVSEAEDDEPRVDEKARFNADVEVVSDYEADSAEEDETDYATARSRQGDNTTGVTAQVLVPKWTSRARKELAKLREDFGSFHDEDEEADISMVAEYGEEIFEYMRDLEVNHYYSLSVISTLTVVSRKKCVPMPVIWTSSPKFNGRCVQS